jgi:hypothetical protein
MEIKLSKLVIERGSLVKTAEIFLKPNGLCEVWIEGKLKRTYPTVEDVFKYETFFITDSEYLFRMN